MTPDWLQIVLALAVCIAIPLILVMRKELL